jgi:N-acetylneuraminic acid mutarotase
VASNGYLYAMGGGDASCATQGTVYYAQLNGDGSTGAWQTNSNALPLALDGFSSVAANGYVYVLGGRDGSNTVRSAVYYAQINGDGSLGAWSTDINALPVARAVHDSVIVNGFVYVVGGENSSFAPQSTIYYARLNLDGSTGAWTTNTSSLPATRHHFGIGMAGNYMYVVGGATTNNAATATVYYTLAM